MKLQLLSLLCLFALASALVARKPSRQASGLSPSSRMDNYGLTARDDDFDICYRHDLFGPYKRCWECDEDKHCSNDRDCRDDDDDDDRDDDDDEYCIGGYCCEFEGNRCRNNRDCNDDDDDDD